MSGLRAEGESELVTVAWHAAARRRAIGHTPRVVLREVNAASTLGAMGNFMRALPNSLWWVTVFFAVLALFTQIAIMIGRSGAVAFWMLLVEFVVTLAILAVPLGLAWRGKQRQSLGYAIGALVVLLGFTRIFFF